jgi:hypothetical protein
LKANLVALIFVSIAMAATLASMGCSKTNVSSPAPTAPAVPTAAVAAAEEDSALDELDPFADDVGLKLAQMDQDYESSTGEAAHVFVPHFFDTGCRQLTCAVYARVERSEQQLYLYVNGILQGKFATSTGIAGRDTPNFDKHPDGRIYDHHTSSKFPGGDYNGLGNMPYAVFISGGFAIHGTGKGNWKKLGHVASHGCIRIHPDNALIFNRLVRQYGVVNTWITVE